MDLVERIISKFLQMYFQLISLFLKRRGTVYMLHSVGNNKHQLNISKRSFEQFLHHIKKKRIIRLENWNNEKDFYAISFDDVADSFYYVAYPLLKKHRIPFTIFVSCSLLDKVDYLSSEELKEIASCDLCTIGSHGFEHKYFKDMSLQEAKHDLQASKKMLEYLTNKKVELFAFPYGSFYATGYKNIKTVGYYYKYGFSSVNSNVTIPLFLPHYFIPRICVTEHLIDNF